MKEQKDLWVKFEDCRSAVLSILHYNFKLKNQLQNRSNCVRILYFMYKKKVKCSRILKYNSRDKWKEYQKYSMVQRHFRISCLSLEQHKTLKGKKDADCFHLIKYKSCMHRNTLHLFLSLQQVIIWTPPLLVLSALDCLDSILLRFSCAI